MTRFYKQQFSHTNDRDSIGVLLVNLGTPKSPTAKDVGPYLRQFLSDPRVVEVPKAIWFWILNGIIVPFRSRRSAKAYAKVWGDEGSPLLVYQQQLTHRLQDALGSDMTVELAMTYGEPSIPSALQSLRERRITRLLVLPMYPQYSATTTAAVFDAVTNELQRFRWLPECRFINQYFQYDAWQQAIADSISEYQADNGKPEKLLFSFHGIPQRYFKQGDPYYCQCHASARLIADKLGLSDSDWQVSFQSRLGREPWLQPYTDHTLQSLAQNGVKSVQVVCPGFAVDCLETLEEIAMENRELYIDSGGQSLQYIPALNASQRHVDVVKTLIDSHTKQWPDSFSGDTQAGGLRQQRAEQRAQLDNYDL